MHRTFGRLNRGQFFLFWALCVVVGLLGCGSPITLDLLTSLNRSARVELSCRWSQGVSRDVHYGVYKDDKNEVITDETPERLLEAVKTADAITFYAPESPVCRSNAAQKPVQIGVIWTLSSPPDELPELEVSSEVREALESSLTQACTTEPNSIDKVFLGQSTTLRHPALKSAQAEKITQALRQALRGHVNDLIKYGPLGRDFAEAARQVQKQDSATTVEPIDTAAGQFVGGAAAGIPGAMVPGGAVITQALIDQGVLPRGTREAQLGKSLSEMVVGAGQVFVGVDGAIIGGGMSLTGGGAIAGVPLCVGSLTLAVNGAVTVLQAGKSLTIVLCRWEDEPAAGAAKPSEEAPPASTQAAAKPPSSSSATQTKAAELKPYKEGAGHHVPAKKAFETPSGYAPGYDPKKALAIPKAELDRLEIDHLKKLTPEQMKAYKAYAETGKPLTWEAIAQIETDALVKAGMPLDMAKATLAKAIQALKDAGVVAPVRTPWGK